jgi:methylmalonyl-CoA mutase C-terminal domain/subunit
MDAGFEVVQLGQATADEIGKAAADEDVDVVGLNIGGRVEVALRVIETVREKAGPLPVIAVGTIPPWAVRELEQRGVRVFPPGSSLESIVAAARELGTRAT